MKLQTWSVVLAIAVAGACGTSTANRGDQGGGRQTDPTIVTADELWNASESNLFDFIRARRPMWLRAQKPRTLRSDAPAMVVYLDNTRLGGLEMLRQFAPNSVMAVRYFSPSAAQARFGPGHLNGAIQLSSRRQTQ